MKRLLLVALPLALLVAGYLFIKWDPTPPRFQRLYSFSAPPYTTLSYDFLGSRPFAGGKMWISLHNNTNWWGAYLFDIEQRKIIGEIQNAWPVLLNSNQTQLLCVRRDAAQASVLDKARLLAEKLVSHRFLPWKPNSAGDDVETFWLLDLSSNEVVPLGTLSQFRGTGSTFQPSADARFAFNLSVASHDSLLVCDLEDRKSKTIKIQKDSWPIGWWDNQSVLCVNQTNDFSLLDVVSERTSPLLYGSNVVAFLEQHGIAHQGQRPTAFANWNGGQFNFYVTDTHRKWLATNSFLLKLERPDARLSLVAPDFKFEWSDHFDESQRYYAYSGRDGGPVDGVFLRDIQTGGERTLIEPKGAKHHSIPNWYGTNVIYRRSNQLWSIDFNGVNQTRLFPPE